MLVISVVSDFVKKLDQHVAGFGSGDLFNWTDLELCDQMRNKRKLGSKLDREITKAETTKKLC